MITTINVLQVIKLDNKGYIPKNSTGFAVGTIKGDLGYLVGWEYEPHIIYPVYKDEIELGEKMSISIDNKTSNVLDAYRRLPPEFEIEIFK